ncbi:MAG: TolC family protein, partial [Woeseiaceae bacterium]|nr:TolC family protein [Woeseiaceae bacterium]
AETLEQAWQAALGADRALQAARSEVSAANEDLAAAKSRRLPAVSAGVGVSRFNEAPAFDFSAAGIPATLPLFGDENLGMANANVTLPLFTGGSLRHGIDAADAMRAAQVSKSDATAQQVKLAVARHYINVLRAQRGLDVAISSVRGLSAHMKDVEDMFEAGAVARNDYLSAAVSLADAEQRRLQAANALDLSRAAYNRALGRELGAPVELDASLPGLDVRLDTDSLGDLTAAAGRNRRELDGLGAAADAYRAEAKAVRGQTLPQLALTGSYYSLENDFLNRDDFWMVGLGVQWNLFDGGQARRKAGALRYRATAISQQRADLASMIELEVRQAWLRLNETRERRRLAERAVEQAEENLRVVRDRYRNGEGTNTEVLDAETLRSLSRSNYDNADFDASLALYELARGVGQL